MDIFIHLLLEALQTRVTRSGAVRKDVVCENCQTRFDYTMSRAVTTKGFSSAQSLGLKAEGKLLRVLAEECDLHPCPGCGRYQQCMVRQVQRKATGKVPLWTVGLALGSAALFVLAGMVSGGQNAAPMWITLGFLTSGAACLLALLLFCGYRLHKRFYDPNAGRG